MEGILKHKDAGNGILDNNKKRMRFESSKMHKNQITGTYLTYGSRNV